MDHVTAIITQLAQGLFESIGSSVLRSVRGRSPPGASRRAAAAPSCASGSSSGCSTGRLGTRIGRSSWLSIGSISRPGSGGGQRSIDRRREGSAGLRSIG